MLTYLLFLTAFSALAAYAHNNDKKTLRRVALGFGVFFASLPVWLIGLFTLSITDNSYVQAYQFTAFAIFAISALVSALPIGYVFLADYVIRLNTKKKVPVGSAQCVSNGKV